MKFKNNEKIWIFSDPHFDHKHICSGSTKWKNNENLRNYSDVKEMNEHIIDNINNNVKINDHLFCLGDWVFSKNVEFFRKQIVCKNLYLILGNHDKHILKKNQYYKNVFSKIEKYLEIRINDIAVIMFHFPIEVWEKSHYGSYHLHGHQHLSKEFKLKKGRKMDVGLDGNDMMPYNFDEIHELLKDREILKHH